MDFEALWNKALKQTEIIRARIQGLKTMNTTLVPYILLSESTINIGDTVVRQGEIHVDKPALIVPPNNPQFHGFELEGEGGVDQNSLINFLLIRGISFPSLHYDNRTSSLDVYEGKLFAAIKHYNQMLQKQENVATGLIAGPEDCWQFSLLLFVCSQIARNAEADIKKLLQEYQKKKGED